MHADFPLPDLSWPGTHGFWEGAAAGELRLPRCAGCGRFHWYPEGPCRSCGADADQGGDGPRRWEAVSGRATLFSWTVVTHAFLPPFRSALPLVPALVSIVEDPDVRIVTRIVDAAPDDLRVDLPVHVVFRPISFDGVDGSVVAPLFAPD